MSEFKLDLSALTPVRATAYPFLPFHRDWIKALRSGKFKQGQGMLCDGNAGYCCLGVLCEVMGTVKRKIALGSGYQFQMPGDDQWSTTGYPSSAIRRAAFLRTDLGAFVQVVRFPGLNYKLHDAIQGGVEGGHTSLASMNDVRMIPAGDGKPPRAFTFAEIADYIEFDPWNVFTDPNATETKAEAAAAAFA